VAFSRGRLDAGSADFVTMEQTSYSPAVLEEAHEIGVDVYLWTVTDAARMRDFVRDGVDGLVTGYPSRALEQREAVGAETGTAQRLEDTLRALVGW
jgi:glycerophosphoryl diester phosphodiesterase